MRRLLIPAIAMFAGLLLIGFIVSLVTNRSLLTQFLPGPQLETMVLSGHETNQRAIDRKDHLKMPTCARKLPG